MQLTFKTLYEQFKIFLTLKTSATKLFYLLFDDKM